MMASGGVLPPDRLNEKYYKCHPKQKCSAVVCIICESAYHMSDFNQLNNTKILSDTLVICPDHVDEINITSKTKDVALNSAARTIIAQIKNNKEQELRKQILKELEEGRDEDDHNATIYEHNTELESIKIENALLKQLNTELQEKNDLLKQLLEKEKSNKNDNIKSYAEMLKNDKPISKRIPKITIKKVNKNEKITTKESVLHYLNKEKSIQTNKVECKNENEVTVICTNEESVKIAEKLLTAKLTNSFKIEKEEIMKPKIKIVGIENYCKWDMAALEQDINNRNFKHTEMKCKVLHLYTNKKTQLQGVLAEVPAELYKNIRDNKNKVFVGHQRCKVYDLINVKPCYNCGRFGHSGLKCHNEKNCLKCAGNHNTNNCNSETLKCLNCSYSNNKYNSNFDIDHATYDSDKCIIMKSKIKSYIEMTDYPMRPVIPSYVDNTGNSHQQKITASSSMASLQSDIRSSSRTKITQNKSQKKTQNG